MTSKIKVDNISKVSDDSNIINKCGTTVTVGAASDGVRTGSNNLQASDGGNLISQSGTTITLGASGDTITLASGASQSGFGRTGTVDWQTGSIKTATFTATNGEGYFCNTSSGSFTVNLPAGTAGAIVAVVDYTNTFQTNSLTLTANGSEVIGGASSSAILSTEGQSATFVYVDGTEGWKLINDATANITGNPYILASGGDAVVTCGNFKTHIFTSPGTFTVSTAAQSAPNNIVDYLVVAGGGSGPSLSAGDGGGGGGGGGMRFFSTAPGCNSPINNSGASPNTEITVSAQGYPITVGAGGATANPGGAGSASVFSTVTSAGGGQGGTPAAAGATGGSGGGGGGGHPSPGPGPGGAGNTPPVAPPQGNNGGQGGGNSPNSQSGGGGGAGGTGGNNPGPTSGPGGVGAYIADAFVGPTAPSYGTSGPVSSTRYFAGGGGGAGRYGPGAAPPGGGGGIGSSGTNGPSQVATAGTVNTGGGGGGGSDRSGGQSGGSGIVMIRYRYQ